MKKVLSTIVAALVALSFASFAFAADANYPEHSGAAEAAKMNQPEAKPVKPQHKHSKKHHKHHKAAKKKTAPATPAPAPAPPVLP